ncbi:MAG: KOW domain-containing RNA-binding protein [Clostridia bacterium]|nr:KOW domain-containing RNA-binding protein [Clostridia bacterium]
MYKARMGDVVMSTAGRDKGKTFLVIDICDGFAYIADGKVRKVLNCKKKNLKHLTKADEASLKGDADKIKRGVPYGNERLNKTIKRAIQNK